MRVDVSFKYIEKSNFIKNVLDNNLQKIQRRVRIFKSIDPIHISIHVEKNPHKDQFFCRSHIYLPTSKVIAADEKGRNSSIAINKTFAALAKQLDKEKHKWNKRRRTPKITPEEF